VGIDGVRLRSASIIAIGLRAQAIAAAAGLEEPSGVPLRASEHQVADAVDPEQRGCCGGVDVVGT